MKINYNGKANEKNIKAILETNFPAAVKYIQEYDFVGGITFIKNSELSGLENVVRTYVSAAGPKIRTKGMVLQKILSDCLKSGMFNGEVDNETLNAMRKEYLKHFN
jgi:hypothetical protein